MPYVNIKVTGGNEAPSAEQKAELTKCVTDWPPVRFMLRVRGEPPLGVFLDIYAAFRILFPYR